MDDVFVKHDLLMLKLVPLALLGVYVLKGIGQLRRVVPDGIRRRARHRRAPPRALRPHPGHAAGVLHLAALGRAPGARRQRRRPDRPPHLAPARGYGSPAGNDRRAARGHVHPRVGARPDRHRGVPGGGRRHLGAGPATLPDQPACPAADRRALRAAAGVVHQHQDREGVRARGARAGALRPAQRRADAAGAEGPPDRSALRRR